MPDWSRVDAACAAASTVKYRPQFDQLFSQISASREGKPTILRTINRYNDVIGWPEGHLTPVQDEQTTMLLDAWNPMLCGSAETRGLTCVDVYDAFNGPDGSRPSADLLAKDYTHPPTKEMR